LAGVLFLSFDLTAKEPAPYQLGILTTFVIPRCFQKADIMVEKRRTVLILGSGADALNASRWPSGLFYSIVAINNAWQVRPDWTHLIYPEDFPVDRRPKDFDAARQFFVAAKDFVPVQNEFGGFVYAGGTMAFTAGYWALGALKPDVLAFFGCDMNYGKGPTHFYGKGTADPLREDITLQSLEAKSARLMYMALEKGCLTVNLSEQPTSRLLFPNHSIGQMNAWNKRTVDGQLACLRQSGNQTKADDALLREAELGYMAASGRYWEGPGRFDAAELRKLDGLWLDWANPINHI
jgi:hypothetical protein